jgi:uncharacterized protein YbaR (Trm112 family)
MTDPTAMTDPADTTEPTDGSERRPAPVDPRLLDLLVCPLTKGPLRYDRARQELISEQAGLAYPIRDGIPIMLVDEARPLDQDEAIPEAVRARRGRPGPGGDERG